MGVGNLEDEMSVTNQDEYKLPNGQIVSIQYDTMKDMWEVACWNTDDSNHWYKEYKTQEAAKAEYERWIP